MSRSVSYLNNAETIIFFTAEWINNCLDENEEPDYDLSRLNYEDFESNLIAEITAKLKSYFEPYKDKWDNRETKIILENKLCKIGLSEYCGAWSLSVALKDYLEDYQSPLALNHADSIKNTLEKCLEKAGAKVMYLQGRFSNGEAVYRYKGDKNGR